MILFDLRPHCHDQLGGLGGGLKPVGLTGVCTPDLQIHARQGSCTQNFWLGLRLEEPQSLNKEGHENNKLVDALRLLRHPKTEFLSDIKQASRPSSWREAFHEILGCVCVLVETNQS